MAVGQRTKITLACAECKNRNYSTMKNKKNTTERLELSKYCKSCKKHTAHKETKQDHIFLKIGSDKMSKEKEVVKAEKTDKSVKKSAEKKVKKKRKHIWTYFKDMYLELRKVTWPNKKDLKTYTISVCIFVVFMAIVTGLLDLAAVSLINWMTGSGMKDLPSLLNGLK